MVVGNWCAVVRKSLNFSLDVIVSGSFMLRSNKMKQCCEKPLAAWGTDTDTGTDRARRIDVWVFVCACQSQRRKRKTEFIRQVNIEATTDGVWNINIHQLAIYWNVSVIDFQGKWMDMLDHVVERSCCFFLLQ